MIEIKDLLARFETILFSEESKVETIRATISDAIHLEIKKEDIKIKNGVVYLNIKPIYKSEILLKKDEIFAELEKRLGKNTPENIR